MRKPLVLRRVRATCAEFPAIENRHARPGAGEVIGAGGPDDAAARAWESAQDSLARTFIHEWEHYDTLRMAMNVPGLRFPGDAPTRRRRAAVDSPGAGNPGGDTQ